MNHFPAFAAKAPDRGKMVQVRVEAHASHRLFGRLQGNEELELQRALKLVDRHHLTGPAEERIAGRCDPAVQSQVLGQLAPAIDPPVAKADNLAGSADTDVLAHAKRLQARKLR